MSHPRCTRLLLLATLCLILIVALVDSLAAQSPPRQAAPPPPRIQSLPPQTVPPQSVLQRQPAPQPQSIPQPAPQPSPPIQPQPIPKLQPGTVVADQPPAQWTSLVFKYLPRIEPDQAQKLGPLAAKLASMLYCTLVVRTSPQPGTNPPQYVLSGLASGVGTNVQGRDIIVSSETQAQLGANFGFIPRIVLSRTEDEVSNYRLVAHSPRLAIVDCPTAVHADGQHRKMNLRYVLLVDPRNGRVHSLLWPLMLDAQGRSLPSPAPPRWLAPNLIHDYPLFVDSNHVYAGVPTSAALAMGRLPDGFPLAPNAALQQMIPAPRFTPELLQQVEQQLWPLLAQTARAAPRPTPTQRFTPAQQPLTPNQPGRTAQPGYPAAPRTSQPILR